MKKVVVLALFLSIFLLVLPVSSRAEDASPASSADTAKKLDEVLLNQKKILELLEQMKIDLNIAKIRASDR